MKILIILLVCIGLLVGRADSKIIDGIEYEPYGLLNKEENRDPNIKYEL